MPDPRQIEDTQIAGELLDYIKQLEARDAVRNTDYEDYEAMYLMEWEGADDPRLAGMRPTIETSARESIEGMTRLLIGQDPVWKIDAEKAPSAELIETELTAWWNGSSRAAKQPHHYDLVRSGVLYGAMDAAISPTQDLLAYARKSKSKATIAAAEKLADRTAFLVDVWNPKAGHPAYDAFGLAAYARTVQMTTAEIESRYGQLPETMKQNSTRWKSRKLTIYYDREWYAVWVDGTPICCKKHNLPSIPIMSQGVDGSMLFDKAEYQRQPPLYALKKSGLWNAQCLYLTVAFTTVLAMGSVPKWIHVAPPSAPGKTLASSFDWNNFVIELEAGEQVSPLVTKGLLDPDAAAMYQVASEKSQGVTIHKQALGAPLNRDATYSEISLLAQAGRLPLIAPQRKGGWGLGELAEMMLAWAREEPRHLKNSRLKKGDIPKNLEVLCALEVSLPQDVLQNANIARLLSQGDDPLTSKEWTLENILKIQQPQKEQKRIWNEKAAAMAALQEIQKVMQEMQAAAQEEAAKAAAGANQFPGAAVPPGAPGQPGEPMPGAAAPQAGPMMGSPDQAQMIQGGLPQQMAGSLPGMGQGTVPEGMNGGMPNA